MSGSATRKTRPDAPTPRRRLRAAVWAGAPLLLVLGLVVRSAPAVPQEEGDMPQDVIQRIQWSEDVIGLLRRTTDALKASVKNLRLPDPLAIAHFTPEVRVVDVERREEAHGAVGALQGLLEDSAWTVGRERTVARAELSLWADVFADVEYFDHASFSVVRGEFDAPRSFRTDVKFGANGRRRSGHKVHLSGHLELHWEYGPRGEKKKTWRIDGWRTLDLHETAVARPLFDEVLHEALPDPVARAAARRSIQQERVVEYFLDSEKEKPRWFQAADWDRHPGLAVVDVDGDGLDDLYVMKRYGANQLLRNRGDGTFEEAAERFDLDLEDHTSSAIFADFDNDGDPDAVVGRTLGRSAYLVNDGGRFRAQPDRVDRPLPFLVSSVAAADVDRDGLLDAYVSTYAAAMIQEELDVATAAPVTEDVVARAEVVLEEFLEPEQARHLGELFAGDANLIRNRPGPPNAFLRNAGRGRLTLAPADHPLTVWKNTYQSMFFDHDDDGDPDVYVANDFSPNVLFANDGAGGMVDVTAATGTADIGFGMGAAAADFDADGDQDLYVSNMFTKAGRRITAQAPELDERFKLMTRGNSLFRNEGGRFERVSGLEPPALLVENAGWSWGGQFLDFNNDAWLDVYAPSGYYSAPRQIAIPVDT